MRKKHIARSLYVFFIISILGLFSVFFLNKFLKHSDNLSLFNKEKNVRNIVFDLQKSYQTNLEISSNSGLIKGKINRSSQEISFDILEPPVLSGAKIIYNKDGAVLKYKDVISDINDSFIISKFPVSMVIEIENMVYNGGYDSCDIKNDILIVEGEYNHKPYVLKADLRRNRIISIDVNDENLIANYQEL